MLLLLLLLCGIADTMYSAEMGRAGFNVLKYADLA